MPCAHDVKRKKRREIEPEKSPRFGSIMRDQAAGQSLQHKEQRRYEQKPYDGSLSRRNSNLLDGIKLDRLRFRITPAEPVVAAKKIQDESRPSQQADDRNHAPGNGIGGDGITCQRLWRPVIAVRIGVSRTIGSRGPGRPCKKSGEFVNIIRVRDPLCLRSATRSL